MIAANGNGAARGSRRGERTRTCAGTTAAVGERMTKMMNIALGLALVLGACSKKDKDAGGDKSDKADKSDKGGGGGGGNVDASKANAAIPSSWKGKIEFTSQKLGEGKFGDPVYVAAPKDWAKGFMEGSLEPPKGSQGWPFGTSFRAGESCEGECKARSDAEWASAGEKSMFGNVTKDGEVIKDDKGAGHHTVIVHNKSNGIAKTQIILANWKDGGERMFFCTVDLPDDVKDLVGAFEQACATVVSAK